MNDKDSTLIVKSEAQEIIINSTEPCWFMLKMETYLWKEVNIQRIQLDVTELPLSSSVLIQHSYNPLNVNSVQNRTVLLNKGETFQTRNNEKVFVLTQGKGQFKFSYKWWMKNVVNEENWDQFDLIITVYIGFTMLFAAFCFFEGPIIYRKVTAFFRKRKLHQAQEQAFVGLDLTEAHEVEDDLQLDYGMIALKSKGGKHK